MKGIYNTPQGKQMIIALYDEQLSRIKTPYQDIYIDTSFGKTHLVETGNPDGLPLLVFHGGNATTAYNLLVSQFLLDDFHISALGFAKIRCFGGSFGAGILAKTMCVAPEKIEKVVLYVPSGIKNAPAISLISMAFPMMLYWITHKQKWFIKTLLPMAVSEDNIDSDTLETAKCSIDNAKIKAGMPSNVYPDDMSKCLAPTLILAGEKDCMFSAKLVIPQAEKMIANCTTYLMQGRGHLHRLTEMEEQKIVQFLK